MELIVITGIVIVGVIGFIALLAIEQHDKTQRQLNGLPQKKYHDITDQDVTTVYTIRHK